MIFGMDWLSQYFATVDCRRKEVIFRISNDEEFKFVGDKSSAPQNLISAITARKMLKKSVRDTWHWSEMLQLRRHLSQMF